jgi:hypothetical protein
MTLQYATHKALVCVSMGPWHYITRQRRRWFVSAWSHDTTVRDTDGAGLCQHCPMTLQYATQKALVCVSMVPWHYSTRHRRRWFVSEWSHDTTVRDTEGAGLCQHGPMTLQYATQKTLVCVNMVPWHYSTRHGRRWFVSAWSHDTTVRDTEGAGLCQHGPMTLHYATQKALVCVSMVPWRYSTRHRRRWFVSELSHDTTVRDTEVAGLCQHGPMTLQYATQKALVCVRMVPWRYSTRHRRPHFYSIRCESVRSTSVRSKTQWDQRGVRGSRQGSINCTFYKHYFPAAILIALCLSSCVDSVFMRLFSFCPQANDVGVANCCRGSQYEYDCRLGCCAV